MDDGLISRRRIPGLVAYQHFPPDCCRLDNPIFAMAAAAEVIDEVELWRQIVDHPGLRSYERRWYAFFIRSHAAWPGEGKPAKDDP
jgi:hypothetical protein